MMHACVAPLPKFFNINKIVEPHVSQIGKRNQLIISFRSLDITEIFANFKLVCSKSVSAKKKKAVTTNVFSVMSQYSCYNDDIKDITISNRLLH